MGAVLNLKIAVEQTSFLFLSRKERKEHKERMFLLIIIAVLSVRQFTQLVKAKNRKHAWIIRNKLHIAMCFATFASFAAKILESNCDVWDNFNDCFRYWEIGSLGVKENFL